MSIDRLVIAYSQCVTDADLERFWDSLSEAEHRALHRRLSQLDPPDPNRCQVMPHRLREVMLDRSSSEREAVKWALAGARACANRAGRTEACCACEQFIDDWE
jgi:hypothetical protein